MELLLALFIDVWLTLEPLLERALVLLHIHLLMLENHTLFFNLVVSIDTIDIFVRVLQVREALLRHVGRQRFSHQLPLGRVGVHSLKIRHLGAELLVSRGLALLH